MGTVSPVPGLLMTVCTLCGDSRPCWGLKRVHFLPASSIGWTVISSLSFLCDSLALLLSAVEGHFPLKVLRRGCDIVTGQRSHTEGSCASISPGRASQYVKCL